MNVKRRKNKRGAGRPTEGRVKLTVYVKPSTAEKIRSQSRGRTLGKVLDELL